MSNSRLLSYSSPHHAGVSAEVFVGDLNKTTGIYLIHLTHEIDVQTDIEMTLVMDKMSVF